MKKFYLLLLSFSLTLIGTPAWTAELTPPSKITHVTVYRDQALVQRTATLELEAGEHVVRFENLPQSILEESLRISGKSQGTVVFRSVELDKNFTPRPEDGYAAELRQEILALQDETQALQDQRGVLGEEKTFLDNIRNVSASQLPKDILTHMPTGADLAGLYQFLSGGYLALSEKTRALDVSIREKNLKIKALQRKLADIGASSDTQKNTALVRLSSAVKTEATLELFYLVSGATWEISYDVKADTSKKNMSLVSYGNVRQWTGENWTETTLTLSSAKPSLGGKMPKLDPWYVNYFEATPIYARESMMLEESDGSFRRKASRMALTASAQLADEAVTAQKVVTENAVVSQETGAVTFEVPKVVTVAADNSPQKFPLQTEDFSLSLDYRATPKLAEYAFIHSKIINDKDHLIPAGSANIFVNDRYLGRSSLDSVGPGETFDLDLGVDEEVKVKRKEMTDKKKKSLMGLRAKRDYAYRIEVQNYKKEDIKITLIDQWPVSKNDEIKSSLSATDPKPTRSLELGMLEWDMTLKPAEKKNVEFQFSVEYPSDREISGL